MHFNNKRHRGAAFPGNSEFDESTDPGLDRMATQYVVDPDAAPPVGGYPTPYINQKTNSAQPGSGFTGQMPQLTPPFNNPTGGFQKVPSGFIPSDQIAGELSSPGFQQPRPSGSFEQLSSAGMMSPGFQQPRPIGSFEQLSSAGMMSPGFQQPRPSGSFEQISSAGMMSPGFQNLVAPPPNSPVMPEADTKIRIRYALAAGGCGAVVGLLLGVLNTLMQGWQINQGTPQTLVLVGLFTMVFGAIAYFRRERVDELLAQVNLGEISEFLSQTSTKPSTKPAGHTPLKAPAGSFQPPADAMYRNVPSGAFQAPDPDSTDEIHIR